MIQLPKSTANAAARTATVEVPLAGSVDVLGRPFVVTVTASAPTASPLVAWMCTTRLLVVDEPGQAKVTWVVAMPLPFVMLEVGTNLSPAMLPPLNVQTTVTAVSGAPTSSRTRAWSVAVVPHETLPAGPDTVIVVATAPP